MMTMICRSRAGGFEFALGSSRVPQFVTTLPKMAMTIKQRCLTSPPSRTRICLGCVFFLPLHGFVINPLAPL